MASKIKKRSALVYIIIVNWNGGDTTMECLKSLYKLTDYPNFKVVVVDNGSTDKSPEKIARTFKQVEVLKLSKNIGYTKGMNHGWHHVLSKYKPEYICNMNDDIITTQPAWLTLMVNELEKNPSFAIAGNRLVFPDGRLQLLYWGREHNNNFQEMDKGQHSYVKVVRAVGGANMLIKVKLINKIGGLDENYFYGPDDLDYCSRANSANFKCVYVGTSTSTHIGSFSYKSAAKDFIYGHQSFGTLLFTYRYASSIDKLIWTFKEIVRCFVTRKNPFGPWTINNAYFHSTWYKRAKLLLIALKNVFKYYNTILLDEFNGETKT